MSLKQYHRDCLSRGENQTEHLKAKTVKSQQLMIMNEISNKVECVSASPVGHEGRWVCGTPQIESLAVGWEGWARWWPARPTLSSACWQTQNTNAAGSWKACRDGNTPWFNVAGQAAKVESKWMINAILSGAVVLTIWSLPRKSWKTRRKPEIPRSQSGWSMSSGVCPERAGTTERGH